MAKRTVARYTPLLSYVLGSMVVLNPRETLQQTKEQPKSDVPRWAKWFLAAILVAGAGIRIGTLDRLPLWVDEAESSINALTILSEGVPRDRYLGLPLFENTLITPWPQNAEYEFKDISYSEKGVTVYHGWLPLYAIAASFAAFGIEPDAPRTTLKPLYDAEERYRRTIAARIPSVISGILTLVFLFVAGRELFSWEAGICATTMASFWSMHIYISQQARYYSLTVLLTGVSGLMIWRIAKHNRWRDWIGAAIALAGLFHTHAISFVALGVLLGCCIIFYKQLRTAVPRIAVLGGIVLLLCAPWIYFTGLLTHGPKIPKAWQLFSSPLDMLPVSPLSAAYAVLFALGITFVLRAKLLGRFRRLRAMDEYMRSHRESVFFLYGWLFIGYLSFLLMPAVSFFAYRMGVTLLAPILLLAAGILTAFARVISARRASVAAMATGIVWVGICDSLKPSWAKLDPGLAHRDVDAAVEFLETHSFPANTRLYTTPNEHFVLMFYTGLPVQSIAPVRREFLSSYPSAVVLFERADLLRMPDDPAHPRNISRTAQAAGLLLSEEESQRLAWRIATEDLPTLLQGRVADIELDGTPIPKFALPLSREHREFVFSTEAKAAANSAQKLVFRGFELHNSYDWWTAYFYRFVDPLRRRAQPVYAERLQNSTAHILAANWIAYYSPPIQ
jgi:hypothetical protein